MTSFSNISPLMFFYPGKDLRTRNKEGDILGYYRSDLEEGFSKEFAIYDLPNLLKTLKLFNEPELFLEDDLIVIKDDFSKATYCYGDIEALRAADKKEAPEAVTKFPTDGICEFNLSSEFFTRIISAAMLISPEFVAFSTVSGDDNLILRTYKSNSSTSQILNNDNKFSIVIDKVPPEIEFTCVFAMDTVNILDRNTDYHVTISDKGAAHFYSDTFEYYIRSDKESNFVNM